MDSSFHCTSGMLQADMPKMNFFPSFFLKPKVLVDVTEAKMVRGWEVKRTFQTFFQILFLFFLPPEV